MKIVQWLYSNIFLRNMLTDIFGRTAYSKEPGGFVPYFQYKIGSYRQDQYLYFLEEPFATRYRNEIFNKLNEYSGSDIPLYLSFHYAAYHDKTDFLQFLQYEISDRLNRKPSQERKQKLQTAQLWLTQKQQELQSLKEASLKEEIKLEVQEIVTHREIVNPAKTDELVNDLAEKLTGLVEKLREGYTTGNIQVTEKKHLESLIQLFYILQTLQFSNGNSKAKIRLFNNFTAMDLASLLRLHFADYKDKQQNTIQKEIAQVAKDFDPGSEKFKKLDKALQDFFFN